MMYVKFIIVIVIIIIFLIFDIIDWYICIHFCGFSINVSIYYMISNIR